MTHHTEADALVRSLLGGGPRAEAEVLAALPDADSVPVLVAGAVLSGSTGPLDRAERYAASARDRQLVELARRFLEGPRDLFDGLVRDHLATYPDNLLAAWLAARQG